MNLSVNFNIDEYSNQKFVSNNQFLLTKYIHAIISFESVELCEKNWELFLESLTEKKNALPLKFFCHLSKILTVDTKDLTNYWKWHDNYIA